MLDKYEASSQAIVEAMFDLANLQPGEVHIDLGSGDGRFVEEALLRGAKSTGYEINKALADESAARLGRNRIINNDCFNADVSRADVVTCYFSILPDTKLLMDKLYKEMKVGARLVKQAYTPHTWKPERDPSLPGRTKESFQNEDVMRVDGNILCLYIKR